MSGEENSKRPVIVVVSGLPRSGTSLLMQMLEAAGWPLLVDGGRAPDADNPNGYFEFDPVKRLSRDASFLAQAEGRAVKIVAPLLRHLPDDYAYQVVFVERALDEVLASQAVMLRRQGAGPVAADDPALRRAFESSLIRAREWIDAAPDRKACFVSHAETLRDPEATARRVGDFLGGIAPCAGSAAPALRAWADRWASDEAQLVGRMAAVVDTSLHRQHLRDGARS